MEDDTEFDAIEAEFGRTSTKTVDTVTFHANIPDIATAWTISGENPPSARVKLDIPASDLAAAMPLMKAAGRLLRITVEIAEEGLF